MPCTSRFAVFVNSSDGYSDCWCPFFRLFRHYYPEHPSRLYLNTEVESYQNAPQSLVSTRVAADADHRLPWGECLIRGLRTVASDIILYMQEDYFINAPIDAAKIHEYVGLMATRPDIGHIGLTKFGSLGPYRDTNLHDSLLEIVPGRRYSASTQAGLWRKSVLSSLVCEWENGWLFEMAASVRTKRLSHRLLTVKPSLLKSDGPIVSYVHTGIEKGRWNRAIPALFCSHNIDWIDYEKRGFAKKDQPAFLRRANTALRVIRNPSNAIRSALTAVTAYGSRLPKSS